MRQPGKSKVKEEVFIPVTKAAAQFGVCLGSIEIIGINSIQ